MALPPGIPVKSVTIGIASFFDGSLAEGTVTITAPVNVIHTPTNRPIFSSQISKRFVDGEATFNLCPTDAPGLNRIDWAFKANIVISGALVQPDPIYFTLPTNGPDVVDLDGLVTVPSSAGTPISVQVLTAEDLPDYLADAFAQGVPPAGGAGGALAGSYPNPGLNGNAVDELVAGLVVDTDSATAVAQRAAFVTPVDAGTNLAMARPAGAGIVYWLFDSGVDPGDSGENVVNRQAGDLIYVADA